VQSRGPVTRSQLNLGGHNLWPGHRSKFVPMGVTTHCPQYKTLNTHQFLLGTVSLVAAFHCTHSPTWNRIQSLSDHQNTSSSNINVCLIIRAGHHMSYHESTEELYTDFATWYLNALHILLPTDNQWQHEMSLATTSICMLPRECLYPPTPAHGWQNRSGRPGSWPVDQPMFATIIFPERSVDAIL